MTTDGQRARRDAPSRAADAYGNNPRWRNPAIEFRPVRNGMDYLLSSVTHLTEGDTPPGERDLKYAVLHLHAATEVLLKARLVREHWSLVFKDPSKATRKNFDAGSFSSATLEGTISRLRDIAGIDIGEANRGAITKLSETRNAFTHYGHSGMAYAVESQAIKVLNFLVDFIDQYLYDPTSSSQFGNEYRETMHRIQERLGRIDKLVTDRMRAVSAEIEGQKDQTVQCPACRQYAVVVGPEPRCRFCNAKWDAPELLAVLYVVGVLGPDNGQLARCGVCDEDALERVPEDVTSLVLGAATAADPHTDIGLCFRCGAIYEQRTPELLPERNQP